MTRANINFVWQNVGEAPRTLFIYHNGDQYPSGIRDHFDVLDLVSKKITPKRFKEWAAINYPNDDLNDLGEGGQPRVYYTEGFITDYSYVFEPEAVKVWNWDKLIFTGTRKEFKKWISKIKD